MNIKRCFISGTTKNGYMSHDKIEQEVYTGKGTEKKCVAFGELEGRN